MHNYALDLARFRRALVSIDPEATQILTHAFTKGYFTSAQTYSEHELCLDFDRPSLRYLRFIGDLYSRIHRYVLYETVINGYI